jgi:hypothetical protein
MQRPKPATIAAKLAEIEQRYRRRKRPSPRQLATLRISELNRLFSARYGETMPDDDAGRDDIVVMANHLAATGREIGKCVGAWLEVRAPWYTIADLKYLVAEVATNPQRWKADALAWRLHLTYADRQTLKIKTIGAVDVPRAQRTKLRKERNKELMRKLRAARKLAKRQAL